MAASLAWGQGGFNGPGTYTIRNLKSGLIMDLDPQDRVTVVQSVPRGTASQQWIIEDSGGGTFTIRNAMTRKAMEFVQDRNSSPVVCQSDQRNPNQAWRIVPGKDGNAIFVSRFRRALDVPDGSSRDLLRWQIYENNGDSNQRFTLQRVEERRESDVRDRDGRGDDRGRPDGRGKYFDDRDRMWKVQGDGVCFYREPDFRGEALCTRTGEDLPDVGRENNGAFLSVKFFGRVREIQIFERPAFRGGTYRISRDESDLRRVRTTWSDNAGDRMGSLRVN
jgi:hypothetical protein